LLSIIQLIAQDAEPEVGPGLAEFLAVLVGFTVWLVFAIRWALKKNRESREQQRPTAPDDLIGD